MKQKTAVVFEITEAEVTEALYDYFVRKLKGRGLNVTFSQEDIEICGYKTGASIRINEIKEIE